jgi:phosphoribosylformimino-5-aminoimidazole carboxamide ribotide isomerase
MAQPVRILPVLDLKRGHVVRGVAGDRQAYRPIRSVLCGDASPVCVAAAVHNLLGVSDCYVADLDAIEGDVAAWDIYRQLENLGLKLWIDAGLRSVRDAEAMARRIADGLQPAAVIAGLESLPDFALLETLRRWIEPTTVVFSLDLIQGQPRTVMDHWRRAAPVELFQRALECGVEHVIVLDLASVGSRRGPTTGPICRELRSKSPRAEIISGGGVRSMDDVRQLTETGCDRVLVASAIHDGSIRQVDLEQPVRSSSPAFPT